MVQTAVGVPLLTDERIAKDAKKEPLAILVQSLISMARLREKQSQNLAPSLVLELAYRRECDQARRLFCDISRSAMQQYGTAPSFNFRNLTEDGLRESYSNYDIAYILGAAAAATGNPSGRRCKSL